MIEYIKESYNELVNKVSWPSWSDLQSSATLVMVASAIFAMLVFLMDLAFQHGMEGLYKMLS